MPAYCGRCERMMSDCECDGPSDRTRYEQELQRAADRLEAVLPIGAYRGVGLLEVCAAIDQLIEIAGDRLLAARADADRRVAEAVKNTRSAGVQ